MPPLYPHDPLAAVQRADWRLLDVALAAADVAGEAWVLALIALALYSWLEREVRGVVKAFLPLTLALGAAGVLALLSRAALATARPVEAAHGLGALLRHALPTGHFAAVTAFATYSLLAYGRRARLVLALAAVLALARAASGAQWGADLAGGAVAGAILGAVAYAAALRLWPDGHLASLKAARRGGGGGVALRPSPPSA